MDCLVSIAHATVRTTPFLPKDPRRIRRKMAPGMTQAVKEPRNPAGRKEAKAKRSVIEKSPEKRQNGDLQRIMTESENPNPVGQGTQPHSVQGDEEE